eukprot:2094960-Rhodomonas_salina.2
MPRTDLAGAATRLLWLRSVCQGESYRMQMLFTSGSDRACVLLGNCMTSHRSTPRPRSTGSITR